MATKLFFSTVFFLGIALALSAPRSGERDIASDIQCATQQFGNFANVAQDYFTLCKEVFGVFNATARAVKDCFDQSSGTSGSSANSNVIAACISLNTAPLLSQAEASVQQAEKIAGELQTIRSQITQCTSGAPATPTS